MGQPALFGPRQAGGGGQDQGFGLPGRHGAIMPTTFSKPESRACIPEAAYLIEDRKLQPVPTVISIVFEAILKQPIGQLFKRLRPEPAGDMPAAAEKFVGTRGLGLADGSR